MSLDSYYSLKIRIDPNSLILIFGATILVYKLNPCLEIYVIPYSANVGNQKRSQ